MIWSVLFWCPQPENNSTTCVPVLRGERGEEWGGGGRGRQEREGPANIPRGDGRAWQARDVLSQSHLSSP
ncbi:mCG146927 [Mus musculus]|nr:mCG146927 [Mus musculus]